MFDFGTATLAKKSDHMTREAQNRRNLLRTICNMKGIPRVTGP